MVDAEHIENGDAFRDGYDHRQLRLDRLDHSVGGGGGTKMMLAPALVWPAASLIVLKTGRPRLLVPPCLVSRRQRPWSHSPSSLPYDAFRPSQSCPDKQRGCRSRPESP